MDKAPVRGDERHAVEAMKRGAHDYLVKGDIDGEQLRSAIEAAIAQATAEHNAAQKLQEL